MKGTGLERASEEVTVTPAEKGETRSSSPTTRTVHVTNLKPFTRLFCKILVWFFKDIFASNGWFWKKNAYNLTKYTESNTDAYIPKYSFPFTKVWSGGCGNFGRSHRRKPRLILCEWQMMWITFRVVQTTFLRVCIPVVQTFWKEQTNAFASTFKRRIVL